MFYNSGPGTNILAYYENVQSFITFFRQAANAGTSRQRMIPLEDLTRQNANPNRPLSSLGKRRDPTSGLIVKEKFTSVIYQCSQ
jgi:hypothetical protein